MPLDLRSRCWDWIDHFLHYFTHFLQARSTRSVHDGCNSAFRKLLEQCLPEYVIRYLFWSIAQNALFRKRIKSIVNVIRQPDLQTELPIGCRQRRLVIRHDVLLSRRQQDRCEDEEKNNDDDEDYGDLDPRQLRLPPFHPSSSCHGNHVTLRTASPSTHKGDTMQPFLAMITPVGSSPGVPTHPIVIPPNPQPPLVIWGPDDPRPTPPIFLPPQTPGEPPTPPVHIWGPTDPRPTPPIFIPPQPPQIWGPGDPRPTPPIYIPPSEPGEEPKPPLILWGPNDPRPTPPIYLPPQVPGQPPQPPVIWGGGNVPMPTPPIYLPPAGGGSPPGPWGPNDPRPTPPIYLPPVTPGDPPLVIWGPGDPRPQPPIHLPPAPPDVDGGGGKPPPADGGWGYHPAYGWGYFPAPGEAQPKKK